VDQINTFVDTICASFLANGSITALYYSNRLMQLPLAIFGLAMATVSLPLMSKAVAKKDITEVAQTLNFSIRFSVIALLPAMIGLIAIGLPIIQVLFERGKFDTYASLLTNKALFYYSLGLPAYAISKVLANTFFSFQDTKTPLKIAIINMIIHTVLCIILMYYLDVGGLAFATAICAYINAYMLARCLKRRIGSIGIKTIFKSFIKGFISSIIMGIVCYVIIKINFANLFISLPISIITGIISFILISKLLKIQEVEILFDSFLKKYNAKTK
jgi:putative peptidoglycan lipid II flippase